MGSQNERSLQDQSNIPTKSSFNFEAVIGRGGFSKVWRVSYKPTKQKYALKQIAKAMILENQTFQSFLNERDFLVSLKNPFIVKIHFAFQDKYYLYIVMDLLTGGDLRYHLMQHVRFTEEQTKFFICSCLIGLECLSNKDIIHRDIKPENLVLDENGNLKITDLGVATKIYKASNREISGTLGYMSPEVMLQRHYTLMTDYFALGVVAYEIMLGKRPYDGVNRYEIRQRIIEQQILVKNSDIPLGWSIESADFINRLLQRAPDDRLGFRGIKDIKSHSWLKYYNWNDLYQQKIIPPYKPIQGSNYDMKYCAKDMSLPKLIKKNYEKWLKDPLRVDPFINYNYSILLLEEESAEKIESVPYIKSESNDYLPTTTSTTRRTPKYKEILNPYISVKDHLNNAKEHKVININAPPGNIDDFRIVFRHPSNKIVNQVNDANTEVTVNDNIYQAAIDIINKDISIKGPLNIANHHESPSTNNSTPQLFNKHKASWIGRIAAEKKREANRILSKYYKNQ